MVRQAWAGQRGSGRGSDALVIVLNLGSANAAARTGRFDLDLVVAHLGNGADRRRQEIGDARACRFGCYRLDLLLVARAALGKLAARTLFALAVVPRAIVTRTLFTRPVLTGTIVTRAFLAVAIAALVALTARLTVLTILTVLTVGTLLAFLTRLVERILVAVAVEALVIAVLVIVLIGTLILEPRAGFAQHTEIVIRELEIIFGLHTVAGELRIAGHVLVLLEQLRGIAPAALFAATAATAASTETSRLLTPTTATAAALAIVHQA
jgi:hypothetical protein